MRDTAGSAAAPAARCKNLRRESFMASPSCPAGAEYHAIAPTAAPLSLADCGGGAEAQKTTSAFGGAADVDRRPTRNASYRRRKFITLLGSTAVSAARSVIAFAFAHLAVEEPVDEADVAENDRQQHQRAQQHEDLARRNGRGLPHRQRRRHEVRESRNHEAEIAEQEQRDRSQERQRFAPF